MFVRTLLLPILPLILFFCTPSGVYGGTLDEEPNYPKGYFKAKGNDPSWILNISNDKIAFEAEQPGFETMQFPHAEPVKVSGYVGIKKYQSKSESAQIEIEIINTACQISESHEGFSYTVKVAIKRNIDSTFIVFNGCGTYITDPRLQERWILEQLKEKPVTLSDFMGQMPSLAIKANGNSFSGFAGCDTISGRIFSERSMLRFTDVVSEKITCDASAMEAAFMQALSFSTQFVVEDKKLTLSNPGGTTLIFRKAE